MGRPADGSGARRRRAWRRRAWAVPAAVAVLAAVCAVAGPGAGGAAPVRYLDRVFDSYTVTSDVVYRPAGEDGAPEDLALDVYEPAGDPATRRPLVVWFHGSGDASHDKADPLDVALVSRFVLHGAVVASVNYRYYNAAPGDVRAAIAFLRAHADDYGIDTDRIVDAGQSAGAIASMNAQYEPDITLGEPPADERADAVMSFAGFGPVADIQAGEPPMFMVHGELDTIAPYSQAVATCDAAKAVGVACEFHSYPADHFGVLAYADEIEQRASAWLYDTLDLAHAQNPPLPSTTTTTTTTAPTSTTTTTTTPSSGPPPTPVPAPGDFAG